MDIRDFPPIGDHCTDMAGWFRGLTIIQGGGVARVRFEVSSRKNYRSGEWLTAHATATGGRRPSIGAADLRGFISRDS
jgi:hypothetical protein